jgi:cytochrome c556
VRSILVAATAVAALTLVSAAKPDPKVVIPARQAGMKQIGGGFKAILDQMQSGAPDGTAVRLNAQKNAGLAPKIPGWFPAGTGPDKGVKTAAKPAIWANKADFDAKAMALASAANALGNAGGSGDRAVIGPLVKQVGGACKACHTAYKVQDS